MAFTATWNSKLAVRPVRSLRTINDPVGLYAGGLQGVTGTSPLTINHAVLGRTNQYVARRRFPVESDLPNIVGLPFASRYATSIRNDQPQIFSMGGRTVRAPNIEFLPLGTGGSQGIARRAPLALNPGASFTQRPSGFMIQRIPILLNNPHEDPFIPTVMSGGMYLTVNAVDTGAATQQLSIPLRYRRRCHGDLRTKCLLAIAIGLGSGPSRFHGRRDRIRRHQVRCAGLLSGDVYDSGSDGRRRFDAPQCSRDRAGRDQSGESAQHRGRHRREPICWPGATW